MKTKFKKIFMCFITMCFMIMNFPATNIKAEESEGNKITVENDGYIASVELQYYNDYASKYEIVENGKSYSIIYDHEDNKVVINNKLYTYEDYLDASLNMSEYLEKGSRKTINLLDFIENYAAENAVKDYDQQNKFAQLSLTSKPTHQHNVLQRCFYCQYDNYTPPTSGYASFPNGWIYVPKMKSILVSLTAQAITTIADYIYFGGLKIARTAMEFLVNYSAGAILGDMVGVDTAYKQAFHSVCPSAVFEKRQLYFIYNGSKVLSNAIYDRYFYTIGPYG